MSASSDHPPKPAEVFDPVYLHARRELVVILLLFGLFCIWSVGVSYSSGYVAAGAEAGEISLTLGMPSWAFWGLLVPWICVDVVAVWFCFFFMKDDDLGETHEGEDLAEQVEHTHEAEHLREAGGQDDE